MSRVNFAVEQGYEIYALNGDLLVAQLSGSAAPGGDTGPQDDAPIGSIYQRTDGKVYKKITDTNALADWVEFSTGSGLLEAPYTPANGDPAVGDTFQEAFEQLDGNQDDLQTLTGEAQGAIDHGTFTGATIPDSSTTHAALQALETAHEEVDANVNDLITLSGVAENSTDLGTFTGDIIADNETVYGALQDLEDAIGAISGGASGSSLAVTTATSMGCVVVDDVDSAEWELVIIDVATEAKKKLKISGLHDGKAAADATVADHDVFSKLKVGASFNASVDVVLTGVGAAQTMCLQVTSTEVSGVNAYWRRTDLP